MAVTMLSESEVARQREFVMRRERAKSEFQKAVQDRRTLKVLHQAEIFTWGDLMDWCLDTEATLQHRMPSPLDQLLWLRGFGKQSWKHVHEAFREAMRIP